METTDINNKSDIVSKAETKNLPEYFKEGFVGRLVDSLPDYIPRELREELKRTRPDPEVEFVKEIGDDYCTKIRVPEDVEEKERDAYVKGIIVLDEITTESLSLEIGFRENPKWDRAGVSSYDNYINQLWNRDENKDKMVGLFQHLHIASLSGDYSEVNYYLQENYNIKDINRLAIEIGKFYLDITKAIPKDKDNSKSGYSYVAGRYYVDRNRIEYSMMGHEYSRKFLRIAKTVGVGSFISLSSALIMLYEYNKIRPAAMMFSAAVIAVPISVFAVEVSREITKSLSRHQENIYRHEIIHHLTHDKIKQRSGPLYYKFINNKP